MVLDGDKYTPFFQMTSKDVNDSNKTAFEKALFNMIGQFIAQKNQMGRAYQQEKMCIKVLLQVIHILCAVVKKKSGQGI